MPYDTFIHDNTHLKNHMARLVQHEEKIPKEIKIGNESKWICMCGLSNNKPLCDGAHKQTEGEEEGKVYQYRNGERVEVSK